MAENAVRIKTDPDPYEPFKLAQAYRVGDLDLRFRASRHRP